MPIAAMDGPFWDVTGLEPIANPQAWSHLTSALNQAQVDQLGGMVAPIDSDDDFRLHVGPGEYAVCYWRVGAGGRITGCSVIELPPEGQLEASDGEGGFAIGVVDR